jgi:nucleoside-diphosphate-sugar epimerase
MKALVTGAGGFCGKILCRFLETQGLEVFALSTRRDADRVFRIKDIADQQGIANALQTARPDYVFHLAGLATSAQDPWQIYTVNIRFAVHLLQAMEAAGLSEVPTLVAGSCAEYGEVAPSALPVSEDHPARPVTHYGISKLAQTCLAIAAFKRGHRIVATRAANILGPGMPTTLFLGSVASQIADICRGRQAATLEVGNLGTVRDFIDVEDAVRCYWRLVNEPGAFGEIVNVSSGTAVPIKTLLDTMIELAGRKIAVVTKAERMKAHDLAVFCASNAKLHSLVQEAPDFCTEHTLRGVLESALAQS